ncbi:MAG: hypothetical protein MJ202_00190 [Lentisphaeria bacterium]|nr:hypothetical protein [Lentisphaeria bacterium]
MDFLDTLGKLMNSARSGEEKAKDVAEAQAEAATLDLAGLKAKVETLLKEIAGKTDLLAGLQEKLKGLSPLDLLGDKGVQLKDQAANLIAIIDSLKTKLEVFQNKVSK